jgi:hypothetical protein
MIEYVILNADSTDELERLVTQKLDEGWMIAGGVSVSVRITSIEKEGIMQYPSYCLEFYQAMFKQEFLGIHS